MLSRCLLCLGLGLSPLPAQTVFSAAIQGTPRLFQEADGVVTAIPTNLPVDGFASLSRDGRFIALVSPDPAQPAQTSQDLFLFDRTTNQRRTLINNTSENLQSGAIATRFPRFSALSPNNSVVALTTNVVITSNLQGSSVTPMLSVHRTSDGFEFANPEFGQGAALDFFRAEHVGLSWIPGSSAFVTPSYVPTFTQTGQPASGVGIARFTLTQNGTYQKSPLTAPRIFDATAPAVNETHIYPAVSPSRAKIAYFEVTWPNALLTEPVTATLITINSDGSGRTPLVSFNAQFYPAGLTWSSDGTQLIFGIGPQAFNGSQFLPEVVPDQTVIRATSSSTPQTPVSLPGIDVGFLPYQSFVAPPSVNLASVPVRLSPNRSGFVLTAPGLPTGQNFILESSATLEGFGTPATFTGAQLANGITISRSSPRQFFRIRLP